MSGSRNRVVFRVRPLHLLGEGWQLPMPAHLPPVGSVFSIDGRDFLVKDYRVEYRSAYPGQLRTPGVPERWPDAPANALAVPMGSDVDEIWTMVVAAPSAPSAPHAPEVAS